MSTGNSRFLYRQIWKLCCTQFSRRWEISSSLIRPRTSTSIWSVNCQSMEWVPSRRSLSDRSDLRISSTSNPFNYWSMMTNIYSSMTRTRAEFTVWIFNWLMLRLSWTELNISLKDPRDCARCERSSYCSLVRQEPQEDQVSCLCSMTVDHKQLELKQRRLW